MELTATQISELLSINRKNSQLMNIYKIPLRKISVGLIFLLYFLNFYNNIMFGLG